MTRTRLLELMADAKAVMDINGPMSIAEKLALIPLLVALVQKDKPEPQQPLISRFERTRNLGSGCIGPSGPSPMQDWTTDPTKGRKPTDGGTP